MSGLDLFLFGLMAVLGLLAAGLVVPMIRSLFRQGTSPRRDRSL